jgi:hypothetical protein
LTNGDVTNTSTSLSSHFLPENIVFAFNTLINNISNVEIGFDNGSSFGKAPVNCVIANNIVSATSNPLIKYYSTTSLAGVSFQNNIMFPSGTSTLGLTGTNFSQINTVDPKLVKINCRAFGQNCSQQTQFELYKLTVESPGIDASVGYEYVIKDMEGQPVIGTRDIGADEYNSIAIIKNSPLDETMVGPTGPEDIIFEKIAATGIQSIDSNEQITSPNPFNNTTRIVVPNQINGKVTVKLYNSLGQQIKVDEQYITTNQFEYELKTDIKGVLFCRIEMPNRTLTIKLISK